MENQNETQVPVVAETAAKTGLWQDVKDAPTGVQVLAGAGAIGIGVAAGWMFTRVRKAYRIAKATMAETVAPTAEAAPAAAPEEMKAGPATEAAAKKAAAK